MRPSILDPLFASATNLPGVGPKVGKLLDKLVGQGDSGARVLDLLFHLPTGTIDRRQRAKIADAPLDQIVMIEATVVEHRAPPPRSRAPHKVLVEDETGDVLLIFFLANLAWIEKSLPVGERRFISGKLELWEGHRQMVHPDRIVDAEGLASMPLVEPVYGLTEGLAPRALAKIISADLTRLPKLPDWLAQTRAKPPGLPSFSAALETLHHPAEPEAIAPMAPARLRLAFDELLAHQLALALTRANLRRAVGRGSQGDGSRSDAIRKSLPFSLTAAQEDALAEIRRDLAAPERMLRLLQGDVGSGKTIVALLAMTDVVEAGRQAALMAPTEVLARQHHESLQKYAAAAGLRLALLTGRDMAAVRTRTLAALAAGDIDIVIGTHALFQESVAFRDLGLAVVDEQHRFGVHQRLALGAKGNGTDILVMTATPIPRTLVLACFGDMDVSTLRDKPPGRQPIETRALPLERIGDVVTRLQGAVADGARAYWICPLVAESETLDVAAVEERYAALKDIFRGEIGLVHGKMKGAERDAAMAAFARGDIKVLVATTVVEVGVDVPEASIIVIEHAERFGLAQLHQLRGRVGRGRTKSTCLLLYKAPLGETAKARIEIMRETEDGFRIAEEDLRLRGGGDAIGTQQSGLPGFRLAQMDIHADLLKLAHAEAHNILATNPKLDGEQGKALLVLLHLFEREAAVKLLQAG
ncbi:MAG: ATP-dependent DNA helicase RecG [Methylovirgula sp.]|uniref:ATP-dependent DNA helicase RecG n=1 Tax=Methylovirgula sp. TaxID=1978224 RepID=UPI00307665DE